MRLLIIALLLSTSANAMTLAQAKSTIVELKSKQNKTIEDVKLLKEAIQIVAGSFALPAQ